MDGQQEWNKVRSQISKNLNPLQPKDRFAINDVIMKKAENIMKKQSLSLIYDEYGNQLYEKTSDVQNYISLDKTGDTFLLRKDDSKLIETKTKNDELNTDFISYDSIVDISRDDVKYNMDIDTDFKELNDKNMYMIQEKTNRKEKVFNDGIQEIKDYINTEGQKDFKKVNKDFLMVVK